MKTETESVIDTSKMSPEQRAALELTEAAREPEVSDRGFVSGLFMGRVNWSALHPYPRQAADAREEGDAFLKRLGDFLKAKVDPDEIDRTGEVPEEVLAGLAELGAFGIKIPQEYGGLELSQTNYCRAAVMLGSYCGNLAALLSAHQSIGVPQPLLLFGTEEQKRQFLPRVAGGEISAFALTETGVGSDPAKMETRAEPSADGREFVINGEKLWCTNGTKAGVIVVMAQTPSKNGKNQITAFIVDMDTPGVEVVRRCHFMGLRALYNGIIRFKDVRVPRENILMAEGKGLRVALTTLNTGRLTLPAACTGLAKRCLEISREWAAQRVQWGAAIGKHAAIGAKLSRMACEIFAMEAMTFYTASLVDRDKHADIRLEAAMAKMWASERTWDIVNETMQIRGGRGYETAESLAARGERPIGVERMLRDARINTIFEGSSEIMRLFIAREALDPHLRVGAPMLNTRLPWQNRVKAAFGAAGFYSTWYPGLWLPATAPAIGDAGYVASTSHRLARAMFHAMAKFGPKLERQQVLLGRFVDIGAELFAIAASSARAAALGDQASKTLAHTFQTMAKGRINCLFHNLHGSNDRAAHRLSSEILEGKHAWLEDGILR